MNRRRYFYSILLILLLIVAVFGWFVTDHLGNNARQEIIRENQTSALTVSIYVSSTLNYLEGAVKSLAGSPWIAPALTSKADQNIENANSALDRYNSALNASVSYLMDADGMTVASSNRKDPDSFVGKSYRFRPYFQEAAKGKPGRYYAMGITSGKRGFYASCPVQNRLGKVLGVVTMKKDLDEMETFISKYPYCFLVSPDGIIFLSSKPAMDLKSLWPLDKTIQEELIASRQFGNKPFEAVMKKEIADGAEVTLEGDDYFVSRKVIDSDGWSIVLLSPTNHVRSYKLIGILATFSVCLLILIFSGVIYATDRSREAVRQSQESYKSLAEKSIAGVYVVQDGKFRFINANAASFAGYTREELLGRDARILISPEDREQVRQNARAMLLDEGNSPYEFRIITKQGEALWIMETVASILYEGRPAILGNSMNITERKQAEEKIRQMAYHDSLTGLPNRKLFSDRLGIALAQAKRNQKGVAVTMLDLDHFKDVNDTLGHDVGDLLLKAAAERLSAALRKGDTVARFGGDEFVLILPDLKGMEDVIQVAQKIVESFRKPFLIDTHELLVTTSIGIAVYPHDGTDEGILLKNADIAMYQVKQAGRDQYQTYKEA
jgi:diguanylate cyclase (GGDEF)-like protein/PAS domain S-box-containing protein